ncbi:hypothetical protein E2562_005587 [Oryza meyeriana var. granulata]|uniref:Uncharacterized protein n=1 Tax=Oryza meyeriana var. granulata TaxID=110450 RepID=A0A6G1F431_9ORYZ|nr:hypothetical protein E2562_005587 [Oryza meyeriana var. granulata]
MKMTASVPQVGDMAGEIDGAGWFCLCREAVRARAGWFQVVSVEVGSMQGDSEVASWEGS